jgi:hypothetical protein
MTPCVVCVMSSWTIRTPLPFERSVMASQVVNSHDRLCGPCQAMFIKNDEGGCIISYRHDSFMFDRNQAIRSWSQTFAMVACYLQTHHIYPFPIAGVKSDFSRLHNSASPNSRYPFLYTSCRVSSKMRCWWQMS